jgi:filamentous hemagglutinin family protein
MHKKRSINKALLFTIPLCLLPVSTLAQEAPISPDGTVSTDVNQQGDVFEITGGAQAGNNLFHSFSNFSVPNGGEAFFNNASEINNIISRVTGGKVSTIEGLIRANGSANLFLINPAGIIFGPNASLNIGGSFLGSTADSLVFPDGEFSAVNAQGKPLLTINAPIGLNFRDNPASIINQSIALDSLNQPVGLQVRPGNNITLVGGELNFDRGILFAPEGRIELGALSAAAEVNFNNDGSLNFSEGASRGDINLRNGAIVSTLGTLGIGGGFITVNANNLEVSGGSLLITGIRQGLGSTDAVAGDIKINASDTVSIDGSNANNSSGIINTLLANSTGKAGNIEITTTNLALTNGGSINANTSGNGNAGNVRINASDRVLFDGFSQSGLPSGIYSSVAQTGIGNAGNVDITTREFSLTNGGSISANTSGNGNAGNVTIKASDRVSFDGISQSGLSSGIYSSITDTGIGNTGKVEINTKNLSLTNGAGINNFNSGQGASGNINVDASDTIIVDGSSQFTTVDGSSQSRRSQISSFVSNTGKGNAGSINLNTKNLTATNGGSIGSLVIGEGNSGDLTINTSETIALDGEAKFDTPLPSQIASNVSPEAVGNSGNIKISTKNLSIEGGALIDAGIFGTGNAGNISISATDNIFVDGKGSNKGALSQIGSRLLPNAIGNGGNVEITTGNLKLSNEGNISADSSGKGNAGSVKIDARENIILERGSVGSSIFSPGTGTGGEIRITAKNVSLFDNSRLDSGSFAKGDAGNIQINASDRIILDNSRINSDVFKISFFDPILERNLEAIGEGNSGNIKLIAPEIFLNNNAVISTRNQGTGNAGNIFLTVSGNLEATNNSRITSNIGRPDGTPSKGKVGNIEIAAKNVFFTNTAQLQAGFYANSQGESGIVSVKATDSISFDGLRSGIFTDVETGAIADGSDIKLEANSITFSNDAVLEASNFGNGNGGNIDITSDRLSLDRSLIESSVVSNSGGSINFQIKDLVSLENKSQISSQATGTGSGGNININASEGFVVATPNQDNDIIATAQSGQGGKIAIDATRVYGFDPENIQSTFSAEEFGVILNNSQNDINSSSGNPELSGTVNINTEQLDPARRTSQSTQNVIEPDETVASACGTDSNGNRTNTFTISGRGGMPPLATEPLESSVIAGQKSDVGANGHSPLQNSKTENHKITSDDIIPARGMMVNEKGQIVLTRYPTPNVSQRPTIDGVNCGNDR